MRIRTLLYYIIAGFVAGMLTLILFQYITNRNVKELISGNEDLLQEYKVSNELVRLQKDILLLDNKIKLAVISRDSIRLHEFQSESMRVKQDLENLRKTDNEIASAIYLKQLDSLINRKISVSQAMVDSFYHAEEVPSETFLSSSPAIRFSESITNLTHKIDTSGRADVAQKVKLVDASGQRVLDWNLYIIALVIFLFVAVFFVIINRMKKQSELISQLNTSERKLKEAVQVKENFLANMSHEIRTPLNAILGYTNLLQKKKLDEDATLHLETVQHSGETLLAIVNDILDLSKIESGMMRIEKIPFDIRTVIHSVRVMLQNKADDKKLKFEINITTELPEKLIGDPTRLTQILVNLLGNAIKFTPSGTVSLNVYPKQNDAELILTEFTINDTGIGIEEKKLDTIFERFRQAEDSITRKYGGTGLGLSIVRDLIYLQNGNIEVKSKPNAGTKVTFSIPYKSGNDHPEISSYNRGTSKPLFTPAFQILIVEDNEVNQNLMAHLVGELGIKSVIVPNGKEAVKPLTTESFNLILTDIQMPEMDGYTLARYIRTELKLNVPIVAMTANAMPGEKEKCLKLGMNDYLTKPIRENELIGVLSGFSVNQRESSPTISNQGDNQNNFEVIDLQYMKEISKGDLEYEKLVTEQFITIIPSELALLKNAFQVSNYGEMQRIAHNMKTTVSIMGLDKQLAEILNTIESTSDEQHLQAAIKSLAVICEKAVREAEQFLSTLP